jgi:hypothetical protein
MKNYKKKRFPDNKILPCFFNIRLKEWTDETRGVMLQGDMSDHAMDDSFGKKQPARQQEPETEENPFD